MTGPKPDSGQAAVELALALPLLMLLMLAVMQLGLVARDAVLVVHAGREAAREGAVTADRGRIRAAAARAGHLDPSRLTVGVVERGPAGQRVRIEVRYRSATTLPLIGPVLPDIALASQATMRVEM